ncbi:cryptochrome/photolyase family protein [Hwanghaeella sp.]|uniref:cryptochrome/photolyase family protein n=1 Tax=Hwanghaeella sp. TaxID=2605943 RepID=UPI003CCBDC91
MSKTTIHWFRRDLRLRDNPALSDAAQEGSVICLFILDDEDAGTQATGAASRWWLHHSLAALTEALKQRGGRLILRRGKAGKIIPDVVSETGADRIVWNRLYEPWSIQRDKQLKSDLTDLGIEADSFASDMIREPWQVETKAGKPFSVFSPFWRAVQDQGDPPSPLPIPDRIYFHTGHVTTDRLEDWGLLPTKPNWAAEFEATWTPGADGAAARMAEFLSGPVNDYKDGRDFPARGATSLMSAPLHFGEVSPRQVWHATRSAMEAGDVRDAAGWSFLRELGWRDFNRHLLFYNPHTVTENFRDNFDSFPWRDDETALEGWTRGRTGYPLVDAGMRELWRTGIMHNRVRMVVASFLVKHLLIDWRQGEAWFRDTLVDADLANNVGGWQWTAGCGADAAPYFRIFNPVAQGEKFDPKGDYIRRWVPELGALPDKYLNKPWEASDKVLAEAGVALGKTYPKPIVDHADARKRALAAFEETKLKQETN